MEKNPTQMNLNLDLYPKSVAECYQYQDEAYRIILNWNRIPLHQQEILEQQNDSLYVAYTVAKFVQYVIMQD